MGAYGLMKEDRMWTDIRPEKTKLLKRYGFNIAGMQYVKRGKSKPWILEYDTSATRHWQCYVLSYLVDQV